MQGLNHQRFSGEMVRLDLGSGGSSASASASASSSSPASLASSYSSSLSIDDDEPADARIHRLISEHPVVIFTRSAACCMCHVMKRLFSTLGVHPAVIELDDSEMAALPSSSAPAVFVGGSPVGGLDSLLALHLSNRLVPKLTEAGAF